MSGSVCFSLYNQPMSHTLDLFILDIPYLFLKKIPYAWIGVIALWSWPPVISGIFFVIIFIGLLMMKWQAIAWESNVRREHKVSGRFYIDRPHTVLMIQARNLAVLFILSALLGWLLNGLAGLSNWKVFTLIAGFMILYKDTLLFGASVTYIVTDEGVGIRYIPGHVDYRLFLRFSEISRIERTDNQARRDWSMMTPTRTVKEGLLLIPRDPNGFSRQIEKVFIAPKNIREFINQLPKSIVYAPKV